MAKNDLVLLDGILDQRVQEKFPSADRGEVFEYFSFEQLLKDYDPSREEIEACWVDGNQDGGIDGFFTFVNGHLVQDLDRLILPRREALIEIWIVTAKHHPTFQLAPVNALVASLPELLDLGIEDVNLKGKYSEELLRARKLFILTYRRLAHTRPNLIFQFAYVSRGDSGLVAEEIAARGKHIASECRALYSDCKASFEFLGASALVERYRRTKKFALDLPILECLTHLQGSYVVLAKLEDYFRFVTDENGQLRRYLFDSNVRDFLGVNQVNEDIAASLQNPSAPDFWWLNNGVTILSTSAKVLGKTIQMQDIQIVNGLQTTETIFRHFACGAKESAVRSVLVKIIVSDDPVVRDNIIRATNNQSVVETASLHATDKIQRDIEEVLERKGWFYERRKNYYRNIGRPQTRMVTPLFIAAANVSLVLKSPAQAATLKSKFMRNPVSYSAVFNEKLPLQVWPAITEIVKRVENGLIAARPSGWHGERFLATYRNILAPAVVARIIGTFAYSVEDLVAFDFARIDSAMIADLWAIACSIENPSRKSKLPRYCHNFYSHVATTHRLEGVEKLSSKRLPTIGGSTKTVSEEFLEIVDKVLPNQPWQPGVHFEVAKKVNCPAAMVRDAIQELITRGRRLPQRNGVVYDQDGRIVSFDPQRVDEASLLL